MQIHIKTISHKDQRYPTVGDWIFDGQGDLYIYISDMNNWKYEFLVALHELIEVMLCKDRGISQESVDDFDIQFEKTRLSGDESEPGNAPHAPYRLEHNIAIFVESAMAQALKVNWSEYDTTINNL